jgi:RND superfamily putative drug exporter
MSLSCSLGLAAIFSHLLFPISATAAQLVVLLVMAVGTDYSLFLITRVRQEVADGAGYREAVLEARGTTGVAVFWSGVTVAASLMGLLLARDSILSSMAIVAVLSVIVALIYTLYVLPSVLILAGRFLEWGTLRARHSNSGKSVMSSFILWSTRNPKTALCCSSLLLAALGAFCLQIKLGSTMQPELLPRRMPSSQLAHDLRQFFPEAAGADLTLIFHAPSLGKLEEDGALQDFIDEFEAREQVRGPVSVEWSDDQSTARYQYSIRGSSLDSENERLVLDVKERMIPAHLLSRNIQGFLSGKLAYDIDQELKYRKVNFAVFSSILLVSLAFLLFAFESVVIPIKALILNLLSSAAAFGLLVLLFQKYGWRYGVVESFVPALLFAILFGLSMDYHLFLISSIKEEVDRGKSTRLAVESAISRTYGVISSAATIMASVFLVISFLDLPLMKQLGLGLAFAVILDATLIRCILLPASVVLLGEMNWYLPQNVKRMIVSIKGRLSGGA